MEKTDTQKNTQQKGPKALRGTVVSNKMKNTVIVRVEDYVKHPKYGKYMRRRKRYAVDSAGREYQIGDTVFIEACRPTSKTKHFRIVSVSGEPKAKPDTAAHS